MKQVAIWTLTGVTPITALFAVTTGLPVPFRGWESGFALITDIPFWVGFFTLLLPVFPALVLVLALLGNFWMKGQPETWVTSGPVVRALAAVAAVISAGVGVSSVLLKWHSGTQDALAAATWFTGLSVAFLGAFLLACKAATGSWFPFSRNTSEGGSTASADRPRE